MMVSIRPLVSKTFNPFTYPLGIIPRAPITIGITVTFMFFSCCFFLILWQDIGIYLSFCFFVFLLYGLPRRSSPLFGKFLWGLTITRFGRDKMIRLNLKITEKFVRLILQGGLWVLHVPIIHIVKFKFFTQLPIDLFPHPVVSSLIFCLL